MKRYLIASACLLSIAPSSLAGSASFADPTGDETWFAGAFFPVSTVDCSDPSVDITRVSIVSDDTSIRGRLDLLAFDGDSWSATCAGVDYPREILAYWVDVVPASGAVSLIATMQVDVFRSGPGVVQLWFDDVGEGAYIGEATMEGGAFVWSSPIRGVVELPSGPRAFDLRAMEASVSATAMGSTGLGVVRSIDALEGGAFTL